VAYHTIARSRVHTIEKHQMTNTKTQRHFFRKKLFLPSAIWCLVHGSVFRYQPQGIRKQFSEKILEEL